jgi:hypothetical protein
VLGIRVGVVTYDDKRSIYYIKRGPRDAGRRFCLFATVDCRPSTS